jgi:hypothetical protein
MYRFLFCAEWKLSWTQEVWSFMVAVLATSTGPAQEALYGTFLIMLIQALAPQSGEADVGICQAAYRMFKAGLQSPKLAHLLPKALSRVSLREKERLRNGIRVAEQSGTSGGPGKGQARSVKPAINFLAFKTK